VLSDWRIFEPDRGVLLEDNVDSEAKAAAVFTGMTGIARRLRKRVVLAAEHGSRRTRPPRDPAVCRADSNGSLTPCDVERERVRCGQ